MKRILAIAFTLTLAMACSASAATFFTEGFDYADGTLTALNPAWVAHSGATQQPIQVVGGEAIVKLPAGQDVNRGTGGPTLAPASTWYYGLTFSIDDLRADPATQIPNAIDMYYIAHFSDTGPANFRGRLYVTAAPSDPTKFTLGIASGTEVNVDVGGSVQLWGSALEFNTTYTAIVSYTATEHDPRVNIPEDAFSPFVVGGNNTVPNPNPQPYAGNDGKATLWVNPESSSDTSVSAFPDGDDIQLHTNGNDLVAASQMRALALRQGSTFGQNGFTIDTFVDIAAIGDDFEDVLAAVSPEEPGQAGDFDGDLDVDGRDFLAWQRGLSTPGGPLSATDLTDWQDNYGVGPLASFAAVPEPGSMCLAAFGLAGILLGKRQR